MDSKLRVGIITIMDASNYGNRLQNYGLQTALEMLGLHVDTFHSDIYVHNKFVRKLKRYVARLFLYHSDGGFQKIIDKFFIVSAKKQKESKASELIEAKKVRVNGFNEKYIRIAKHQIVDGSDNGFVHDYDFFIVGSDQVWNPYYRDGSDIEFLKFVPKEKRVAYSASFSVRVIPGIYKQKYIAGLSGMSAISVREDHAAEMVNSLIECTVPVTLDPTMLLDRDEWKKLTKPHKDKPANRYIVTYFIGGRPLDFDQKLSRYAANQGLEVINLASEKEHEKHFYSADPSEFLEFISDAEAVFTNSYHGAVFSIIFGRRFLVFERQDIGDLSMNSRLDTLLSKFELRGNHRSFQNISEKDLADCQALSDDERLATLRASSLDYLKRALSLE